MDVMMTENERKMETGQRMSAAETKFQRTRLVMRRRREPASALNSDYSQIQKQQQQQKVDENSNTITTKRSSRFRGVSRHRWTGRFEAHLWDKLSWNVTQKKKGKQVYLGAYDEEESAARSYDLAALKYWGTSTFTNFPITDYRKELDTMQTMTKEEYLATLRRKSSGFSRGESKYRGVARHHHNGRWEARIGRVFGNKYLYLGTYSTQEEAAHAYDIAAIEYRGIHAVTNFDMSAYIRWLKPSAGKTPEATQQESQKVPEAQRMTSPSNYNPILEESKTLAIYSNPLLNNNMDYLNSPQKQDVYENKTPPFLGSKSSSPSAVGLLLRSSIFRELVEKNSKISGDETDEDTKDQQPINPGNDELGPIFYDGIGDLPFVCDPNRPYSLDLQERDVLAEMSMISEEQCHAYVTS